MGIKLSISTPKAWYCACYRPFSQGFTWFGGSTEQFLGAWCMVVGLWPGNKPRALEHFFYLVSGKTLLRAEVWNLGKSELKVWMPCSLMVIACPKTNYALWYLSQIVLLHATRQHSLQCYHDALHSKISYLPQYILTGLSPSRLTVPGIKPERKRERMNTKKVVDREWTGRKKEDGKKCDDG